MSEEYKKGTTDLTNGGLLIMEDIDISGMGLYLKKDPNVAEDDYFLTPYTSLGRPLYARKSDEGKKWHIYQDKLVDWSKLKS